MTDDLPKGETGDNYTIKFITTNNQRLSKTFSH